MLAVLILSHVAEAQDGFTELQMEPTSYAERTGFDTEPTVTLHFSADKPDVTLARVLARSVSSDGTTRIAYEDLCRAPCTVHLPAGPYEFRAHGPDVLSIHQRAQLVPGTFRIEAAPAPASVLRPHFVRMAWGVGAMLGGSLLWALPVSGAGGTALNILGTSATLGGVYVVGVGVYGAASEPHGSMAWSGGDYSLP